jgi:hypothetical protein
MWKYRSTRLLLTGLLILIGMLQIRTTQSQPDERCFNETGFCISGRFRAMRMTRMTMVLFRCGDHVRRRGVGYRQSERHR